MNLLQNLIPNLKIRCSFQEARENLPTALGQANLREKMIQIKNRVLPIKTKKSQTPVKKKMMSMMSMMLWLS
jgi:hypothetical protein